MTIVPFGEWLPDQPQFQNQGAATIKNVMPLTAKSYGPVPSPTVYSGALTARCQGSYSFQDASGSVHVFAGDANRLYQLTAGSAPNFSDISKSTGGPYSTAALAGALLPNAPAWSMTSFGERIIASNYADNVQTFLCGTDTKFSDLSAGAPKARFAAVIRDFLMLANTSDATNGAQPRRCWWPAIGNPTSWPTPGTNAALQVESDYQDLEQSDLGEITGLIGGQLSSADGAAFCERGIYSIQYVGSSGGIFSFIVAQGAAGTRAPLSIVRRRLQTQLAGNRAVAYYLGEDDFFAFDGAYSVPIGAQKIAATFFNDLAAQYASIVVGGTVPTLPIVYWLYCSASGLGSGLYDRMLLYNITLQRWSLCDLTATPAEWGTLALAPGFTLDALNAFGTIDQLPAMLDSGYYAGSTSILAAFDQNHKLNFLNGPALAPTVETTELQPTPGRRTKILSARPLCDGGVPSIAIGTRDRLIDAVTYQAAIPVDVIGECPQRITGRYVRARLTLPAASSFTHLQGIDLTARPEGRR